MLDEQFMLIYLTELVVITRQSNQLFSLVIKCNVSRPITVLIRMKHLDKNKCTPLDVFANHTAYKVLITCQSY